MRFHASVSAALACLATLSAAAQGQHPYSSKCYTHMATTRHSPVRTTWSTDYTKCTSTKTSTVTTTITPSQGTITTTTTVTVNTDSTSTVPAPATFLPVQDTLPGSSYSGSGGADPIAKRGVLHARAHARAQSKSKPKPSGHNIFKWQYPQGVNCWQWRPSPKCITTTVTSTTTKTAATPISSTVTSTTTTTVVTSTTTLYAACATNNLADLYNGQGFQDIDGGGVAYTNSDNTDTPTAYDCCVAAITDPNVAAAWIYVPGQTNGCYIGIQPQGGVCDQTVDVITAGLNGGGTEYTIGNAYCGAIDAAQ